MGVELSMLAYSVFLAFLLVVVSVLAAWKEYGLMTLVGPRDEMPDSNDTFLGRAQRTANNHLEGLIYFAPIVLIAAITDRFTDATALGAQLYFFGRLVHAGCYLGGIPWLRTLSWAAAIVGWLMIFSAVVSG